MIFINELAFSQHLNVTQQKVYYKKNKFKSFFNSYFRDKTKIYQTQNEVIDQYNNHLFKDNQCIFFEDFSNPVGWNQIGSLVEINNNKVQFIDGAADGWPDGIQRRLFKKLDIPITDSDLWSASFKFNPQSVGDFGGPFTGHLIFSLSNNTQDPWCDCPDLKCTGYPPGSQDVISVTYMSPNPPNGSFSFYITVRSNKIRYDSPPLTYSKLGDEIYIELIRDNLNFILNIYSDKEHTKPLGNGPVKLKIICLPELNYIQHGNSILGYELRKLTGTLDDICVQISGKCKTKYTSINYNGCQGDGYSILVNGKTYNENNPSGIEILNGINCCDSIILVNLNYQSPKYSNISYEGCQNDGYEIVVNNHNYNEKNPSGIEYLFSTSGCDSIVTINLKFNPKKSKTLNYLGCAGDGYSLIVNGVLYSEINPAGVEYFSTTAGCDSIVYINFKFNKSYFYKFEHTECKGSDYSVKINGNLYNETNPSGIELMHTINGCDSIIIVNLQYTENYETNIIYFGCQNDGYSVRINDKIYDQNNPLGNEIVLSAIGCDSIYHINLTFYKKDTIRLIYDGCVGDKYYIIVGDKLYDESNDKGSEYFTNQFGCDSIVIVDLNYKDCVKLYDELCKIKVPNIFSPDNNGLNDTFFINYNELCELKEFHVFIFDRWGNNIFYSNDIKFKWNGRKNDKELVSGVYTYIIRYLPLYGSEKIKAGDITLIK